MVMDHRDEYSSEWATLTLMSATRRTVPTQSYIIEKHFAGPALQGDIPSRRWRTSWHSCPGPPKTRLSHSKLAGNAMPNDALRHSQSGGWLGGQKARPSLESHAATLSGRSRQIWITEYWAELVPSNNILNHRG